MSARFFGPGTPDEVRLAFCTMAAALIGPESIVKPISEEQRAATAVLLDVFETLNDGERADFLIALTNIAFVRGVQLAVGKITGGRITQIEHGDGDACECPQCVGLRTFEELDHEERFGTRGHN